MDNLKLISAISVDGAIGKDDDLLWHIPEDLKRYKEMTMNNIVIVGLNTFLGMPIEAFKGRLAIIVCGENINISKVSGGKTVFPVNTPSDALELAEKIKDGNQDVYVIGGAQLYESMIDEVDEAKITWVNNLYPDANKKFPIDKLFLDFSENDISSWVSTEEGIIYKFTEYKRIK